MQLLRAIVDLGLMAMKGYSAFPKTPASDSLVSYPEHLLWESYSSAEIQPVSSRSPIVWAIT